MGLTLKYQNKLHKCQNPGEEDRQQGLSGTLSQETPALPLPLTLINTNVAIEISTRHVRGAETAVHRQQTRIEHQKLSLKFKPESTVSL